MSRIAARWLPPARVSHPWATVALASLVMPWMLFQQVTGYAMADPFGTKVLWTAIWPILIGASLALGLFRIETGLPRVPEGDVIALAERLRPIVQATGRGLESADVWLRQWPVASAMLVALAIGIAFAL
jgi:multicomponent Na+:H+ antiporter subunit A